MGVGTESKFERVKALCLEDKNLHLVDNLDLEKMIAELIALYEAQAGLSDEQYDAKLAGLFSLHQILNHEVIVFSKPLKIWWILMQYISGKDDPYAVAKGSRSVTI